MLGWALISFLIVQVLLGLSLLEAVNHSEAYGVARARTATGGTERERSAQSWNDDYIVTNVRRFNLKRYSDHHDYFPPPGAISRFGISKKNSQLSTG